MFLVELKKKKKNILEFIYCRKLNLQYFGAPKSGPPRCGASPRLRVLRGWLLRHWGNILCFRW